MVYAMNSVNDVICSEDVDCMNRMDYLYHSITNRSDTLVDISGQTCQI